MNMFFNSLPAGALTLPRLKRNPGDLPGKYAWRIICLFTLMVLGCMTLPVQADGFEVQDSLGRFIELSQPPGKIVSLVPSASEILVEIGAGKKLAGVTSHDAALKGSAERKILGGFFNPSFLYIKKLEPDFLIVSPIHQQRVEEAISKDIPIFYYDTRRLADAWELMACLGKITGHEEAAENLIKTNKDGLAHITAKLKKADVNPLRVIRLMGRDRVMTPGRDSFQNDMIRAAGGIPPDFTPPGKIVDVSLAQWQAFDPEVIYGCPPDRVVARRFFSQPGWRDVSAVKNQQIYYLPCDLTCRASAGTSAFVSKLASMMYPEAFADIKTVIYPVSKISEQPLSKDLSRDMDYIKKASLVGSYIYDFKNKTLVIDFKSPMTVVSTLEGQRSNITTVGNHYSPPPTWSTGHTRGITDTRQSILTAIDRKPAHTALLMTGADMDNVSINTFSFKDMKVTALVTAGVVSNAMRMAEDTGLWYEPGTINVIILTNMMLTPRAMTRAVITATEAKTAALQDLDIRSAYTGKINPATGTGTDNVLVVQGKGVSVDNAGGHSKMGELMAKAVYAGVKKAVEKQNGLVSGRHVIQRLRDRKISIYQLASTARCECSGNTQKYSAVVEHLLLDPEYAGFMEAALSLSDAWEKGKITDLKAFDLWCRHIAEKITGHKEIEIVPLITDREIPLVIRKAFNALMTKARSLPAPCPG